MERQKIRFASGDTECAAWHYPGTNGGCVVMTGGFAVTKEPGTDLFARRFNEAGFGVLRDLQSLQVLAAAVHGANTVLFQAAQGLRSDHAVAATAKV